MPVGNNVLFLSCWKYVHWKDVHWKDVHWKYDHRKYGHWKKVAAVTLNNQRLKSIKCQSAPFPFIGQVSLVMCHEYVPTDN